MRENRDRTPRHDGGYRLLFTHRRMVADLLRGFVREPFVQELDFTTLERVPGSYVSDRLEARAQDVVWRLRWRDRALYVYLVIEFQSTVDRWMALRLLVYVGLLYQDLIRRGQTLEGGRLPPVLPLVLYNGERPWEAAADVGELIAPGPEGLEAYAPRLRYALIDEGRLPDAALEQPENLMAALAALERSAAPLEVAAVVARLVRWL
ncbi:MAG: transposase, partial [Acidobacteria bacterium]